MSGPSESSHYDVSCLKHNGLCTPWIAHVDSKIRRTVCRGCVTEEAFSLRTTSVQKDERKHCLEMNGQIESRTVLYVSIENVGSNVDLRALIRLYVRKHVLNLLVVSKALVKLSKSVIMIMSFTSFLRILEVEVTSPFVELNEKGSELYTQLECTPAVISPIH